MHHRILLGFSSLVFTILLTVAATGQVQGQAKDKVDPKKDKVDPKKKANLLVPDPLELKEGTRLSNHTLVSEPLPIKGGISWTVEPKRHRGNAGVIAASPDGSLCATSGGDGMIRIWDAATGRLQRILVGHHNGTGGLAFSPDGQTLATTSGDGTARIWNPKTGMTLRILKKHKGGTSRVAWSPNGESLVVTGGASGFATFWDPAGNKQHKTVEHGIAVFDVAWSPDGKTVACGTRDYVALWNAANGEALGEIRPPGNLSYAVAWSLDSATLAIGGRTSLTLWDVAKKEMLREFSGQCTALAWSPDGQKLAANNAGGTSIFNTMTWNVDRKIPFSATSYDWDKSSTRLFACSTTDVMVIDAKGEKGEKTFSVAQTGSLVWSPGRPILSGLFSPTLQSWDVATGRPIALFAGHTAGIDDIQWSRDGKTLATGSADKTARVFDAKSGKLLQTRIHSDIVTAVALGPDGRLATGCRDKMVRIFPADGDDDPKEFKGHMNPVRTVAWSRDGTTLVSGGDEGVVFVWDQATLAPIKKLPIDKDRGILELAFSNDNRQLAAGTLDAKIHIYSNPSGKLITTLDGRGANASYYRFAWSNDGSQLLATTYGLQLWDVKTAAVLRSYSLITSVQNANWSLDNKTVVAACFDRCIRYCDVGTGLVRVTMLHDLKQISAVSHDGHFRAAADLESELVYVIQTDKSQDTYEPKAFAAKFAWRNNPAMVKP